VKIFPVLLDSQPAYLQCLMGHHSLLLMPLGRETMLDHLGRRLAALTSYAPLILTTFAPGETYRNALRYSSVTVDAVLPSQRFEERLWSYEPSDWLLIVDPRRFPARGFDPALLLAKADLHFQGVTHLVTLDSSAEGTREYVQTDPDGRVRRIQRYYEAVTWPFASEVSATLLPAACTLLLAGAPFTSLAQLRHTLASLGVPSRDVPVPMKTFDLGDERGLLGLSERFTIELARDGREGWPANGVASDHGDGAALHPSARLVGPVVVHPGAMIHADATVIGPAVVGARAWVGPGAVVAQSLVAPGTVVPENTLVRHQVWLGYTALMQQGPGRRASDGQRLTSRSGSAPVEMRDDPPPGIAYFFLKRWLDAALAGAGLIALSPLLLLTALLVKLTSRGSIFYGDQREGRGGRVFQCWKFRTMRTGADAQQRQLYAKNEMDGPQFKLKDDPRVTPLGRWLRRLNIDELPQFANVVCGQMSLVGPRPSPFRENQVCVPWRQARLSVRPGITGLWQLCRDDRNGGDFHQWIHYDVLYVRHLSLWTDLKILAATLLTLGGRWRVPPSWLVPMPPGGE